QCMPMSPKHTVRPAPLLDAGGYRGDLGIRVDPGIFCVRDQPLDPPALDLVRRPRSLISRLDSRSRLSPRHAFVGTISQTSRKSRLRNQIVGLAIVGAPAG